MLNKGVLFMKKKRIIPFKYKLSIIISFWIFLAFNLIAFNIYLNTNDSLEKQYNLRKYADTNVSLSNYNFLYSNYNNSDFYLLIMSVLFLVISIVLGALIVFYISNPIKKMMIGIEEVSNGNYDYMIEINTTDEFNMLGKSINNLSRKMKVLIEEKCNKERELLLKDSQIEMQKDVIASQSEQISMLNEKLEELFSENKNICIAAINALTNSLEVKDVYTRGHCERVREYVVKIGQALNLSKNEINELEFAALLHDIGKIGIPSRILNKEDELTEEEAELIKMHPRLGYEIVKNLPFLDNAKYAILQHHERIDGKGYPDGLVDEEISLYSKILAVADAFDAMTTGRKYRIIPYPKEVALEQLIHNKNIQFDARIVDVFVDIIKKEMNEDKNKIPS